jgi:hypothetical protein
MGNSQPLYNRVLERSISKAEDREVDEFGFCNPYPASSGLYIPNAV